MTGELVDASGLTAHLWRLQAQSEELRVRIEDLRAQWQALHDEHRGSSASPPPPLV